MIREQIYHKWILIKWNCKYIVYLFIEFFLFSANGVQQPNEQLCNNMPCVVNCGFCNPRTTQKRGESFGISKIGNKIKGVFKSSAMEGAMLPNYNLNEGEDDFVSKTIKFY